MFLPTNNELSTKKLNTLVLIRIFTRKRTCISARLTLFYYVSAVVNPGLATQSPNNRLSLVRAFHKLPCIYIFKTRFDLKCNKVKSKFVKH